MKTGKKVLSVFLAALTVISMTLPGLSALAAEIDEGGGVIGVYDIEIFYEDGTLVPTYQEDGETAYIEYMYEGDKKQFTYQFIDCTLPDNGYVKWTSDTPTVCDVTEDGLVRAFDSSKGAAVRLWIDNEVATVPLIGSLLKTIFEKALFNDTVNVDTMDTDAIIALVEAAFGSDSLLDQYIDSYKGELIDSLREYLDKVNTTITCTMYDANGNVLDADSFSVTVQKSQEIYADFIPNGTHITNKQDLPTTVAVGSTLQLSACTTPTRLHMGVIYSVKNTSIFDSGKVIATVDDSGLVTFKNTGEVTILVSPDTDGFIENLLKYINYIYELENLGTVDSSQIADILIKYVGLDINRTVLTAILDACFAISDIVGDTADPVQLTATAVKIIANIIYQFTTNDSITFTVVDGVPVTDFEITGANTVREGTEIQLSIENVQPEAADTSDITWTSSDPSIASVDPVTGIITGRDAGGSLGQYSQQTVQITATSAANNVSKTVNITVTGRVGNYLSDVEVTADRDSINLGESQYMHAAVYPSRVAESDNLYFTWGIKTQNAETGEEEILWATQPYQETDAQGNPMVDENGDPVMNDGTATDGIGKIDTNGLYTAVGGGSCTVVCKAQTGYYIGSNFLEISSVQGEKSIDNGQPVQSISLEVTGSVGGSDYAVSEPAEIGGETHQFATVTINALDGNITYVNKGITLKANIAPADATNKTVNWYIDNNNFSLESDAAAGTATVKMKAGNESAQSVNIYCVSADGEVQSGTVTLTVVRNDATSNTIDGDAFSVINGQSIDVTHSMTFGGSLTGSNAACYDANWYSADNDIATVISKDSETGNAVIKGVDVGTTTLYCISTDGGIQDTATVTVYPDKSRLQEIIGLCESTIIKKTEENKEYYQNYMLMLNYAYYINNEMDMASQSVVDTYAEELLYVFYQLGGYVGLNSVTILDNAGKEAPDHISVDVSTLYYYNTSYQLDYELSPKGAMYRNVEWKSSNESEVSVDATGKVTPKNDYTSCYSTITVTATDYFGDTVSDSVVVAFSRTQATGVTLDRTEITGKTGENTTLEATVQPTALGVGSADITDVIWSSSNEDVATVDQDGNVSFVYGGECVITATTADGGHTAQCAVTVQTNYDALQQLITSYKNLSLAAENYYPDTYNAYIQKLNEAQALVDANASSQEEVNEMYAQLEAAYNGLKKYTFIQKVELYLDGEETDNYYQYDLSLLDEGLSYKNAELNLKVRLYPNNASYEKVEWTTSTETITVSQEGVASPAQDSSCYGMVTCTVTDHFGNQYSDDVWVSFAYFPVTSVEINEDEIGGSIGEQYQLNCVVYPTGDSVFHIGQASIKDVVWSSDNESVATVDQTGLVTFTGAGATTIRVTTYDGGYTAECRVSTQGDRSALNNAIAKYADVNYMDYQYEYGMAFKEAYDNAQAALSDDSLVQYEIDQIADALNKAGEALAGHEFVAAKTINLAYENQKKNLLFQFQSKGSGNIDANAATHSFEDSGTGYESRTILTASLPAEAAANYKSLEWSIVSESDADISLSGAQATISQPTADLNASAKSELMITATDYYGRTVTRTIRVVVAEALVNGISLDQTNVERYANEGAFKLNAAVSPSDAGIKDVIWRSDNTNIATVDNEGNVTPVNTGTAVITVETFDGAYTAACTVTFKTDYTQLANLYAQYNEFYENTKDTHTYTNASLQNFKNALDLANKVISEATADQADVNTTIETLNTAYNSLEKFVPVTGVSVTLEESDNASVVNEGFIRYQALALNGASLKLNTALEPADCSSGTTVEWSSSNSNITVDQYGLVTKNGISADYAKITAKVTDEAGNTVENSVYVSFVITPVQSVSFDEEFVYGSPSTTVTLDPKYSGSSAIAIPSVRECVYVSSDPEIATVDDNGVVTFITGGECIITAYAVDGGVSATIRAITTNDTTALNAAISEYSSVNYMDYEYEYGMAFKEAYEHAQAVSKDYLSTQEAIDSACAALRTAYNNLADHPFIEAGTVALKINGTDVKDGESYVKDENNAVVITASHNEGAMIKSAEITYSDAENVTAQVSGDTITVLKDNDAEYGRITITYTVTDDYDRVSEITRTIMVTDALKRIESFKFVYNGEEVDSVAYKNINLYGKSIQLSINTYPEAAENYTSIEWKSSNSKVTVDQNGVVKVDGVILANNYQADITCTITLSDGTQISNTIPVSFTVGF